MLRRIGIISVLSLIVVALTASVALAGHRPGHQPPGQGTGTPGTGNPHYVVGPDVTVDGNLVRATGSIAGLGTEPIDVLLTVTAEQEVQCQNPGGNIAPGQTQTFNTQEGQFGITPERGRATFDIPLEVTGLTEQELRDARACPNPRWTPIPGDVTITGYTLQVFQAGQELTQLGRSATF